MMTRDNPVRLLDLVLLKTFVSVVEQEGFTAAANQLHLAQSTVSAHIRRLEETLGCQLLQRGQVAAHPTQAGERLLAHARHMLRQNTLAWQDVWQQRLHGVVRLGIPDDYLVYLPKALAEFEERYPGVELEVRCGLSVDLIQEVQSGALDLAVVTRQPSSPGGELLCRESMVWACSSGYRPQSRSPLPLAVSRQGVCVFRDRAIAALEAAGIAWRIAYASASLSGLSAAVRAGLAVTVLTPSMAGPDLRLLGVEDGLPELPKTEITLHRRPGTLTEAAEQLAQQLKAHVKARSELDTTTWQDGVASGE
ncbi:LysR substrate-binding domain-containing protein [Marinobacter daepoensis]|uniref:LysR substrate-binding domain-containing protein n=1 Tax=Marinobacter daepoensis TaxID=262077 RepID=UPI001B7FA8F0|nr:LysR substrate-binding domain-containing protein [Marinobacter daepoensis]MBY6032243.1 LysR family transcriptional regulator [Marinobacter daepoensis]